MKKYRLLSVPVYFLRGIRRAVILVAGDVVYVTVRGLSMCAESLRGSFSAKRRTVSRAARRYQSSGSVLRLIWSLLRGEQGIVRSFLRLAVPSACIVTLCAAVHRGTTQPYGVAVAVDGKMLGIVSAESDYMEAEEIVRKRLEGTEAEDSVHFTRSLRLE